MKNRTESISGSLAKNLVLYSQLLDGRSKPAKSKKGVSEIIDQLGYIQIDTHAVINRSHHHTLWVRNDSYNSSMLHDLQSKDKLVFEYWGHAMSYLPIKDFRFALPRMKKFNNPIHKWIKRNLELSRDLFPEIIERIRNEGPLSSQDFKSEDDKPRESWWDWKPAKKALEILYWQGVLMVSERRNFNKYYDLTERVLPDWVNTDMPTDQEIGEYLVNRAVKSMGIATEKEIDRYLQPASGQSGDFQIADKKLIRTTLDNFIEDDLLVPVNIEQQTGVTYYAYKDILDKRFGNKSANVYLLSPFDNLLIQRDRTKAIFGFNYTLECYLPEKKRQFGYFVLPVLFGDKFVARMDVKSFKKEKVLEIKNLVFEQDYKMNEEFLVKFTEKLNDLAAFNSCEQITFIKIKPAKYRSRLSKLVKN